MAIIAGFLSFISHFENCSTPQLYQEVFLLASLHFYVKQTTRANYTKAHLIPPVSFITYSSCFVRDCTTLVNFFITYLPPELVGLC